MALVVVSAQAQKVDAISGATQITAVTGAAYTDVVYWDFDNYDHKSKASEWDIAFSTVIQSANIIINSGNNVMLFPYPNGTIDDWESVDTSDMAWTPLYNSIVSWDEGAFLQNSTSGPFDFGWGTYDMQSHDVIGDSIFIIKLGEYDYRKLAIIKKHSVDNEWHFKFAKLDGTAEKTVVLDANQANSNFAYYSLVNEEYKTEHEPSVWQILFTKYFDASIPYTVSGVLTNKGVKVQEVKQENLD